MNLLPYISYHFKSISKSFQTEIIAQLESIRLFSYSSRKNAPSWSTRYRKFYLSETYLNTKCIRKNIFYIHLSHTFFPFFHDEMLYISHIYFFPWVCLGVEEGLLHGRHDIGSSTYLKPKMPFEFLVSDKQNFRNRVNH